jgi:Fe-S-cluster containining protein
MPPSDPQTRDPVDDLAALYREVDALFEGHACDASTDCCRFAITGREPYVTSVELALLERAVAASGRRRERPGHKGGRGGRGLPLAAADAERRCPLLTPEGRCSVYAARPIGCRTFYCDRATGPTRVRHRDVQELVRRVKDLAARHAPDGDRGRPLTRAMG